MADQKISQLTSATTPLAGTEVLPIVQSGATKQVSVANLTAGRSVDMSTLTVTGNTYLATTSGSVGIGTTSPLNPLHVNSAANTAMRVTTSGAITQLRGYVIGNNASDTTEYGSLKMELSGGELRLSSGYSGWGGYQTFYTDGSERMRITSAGDVGIGTASPSAKLGIQSAYTAGAPTTSSVPTARFNNGGAVSWWFGGTGYSYMWAQSIQDDGTNNLKDIVLQPLGGSVGIGGSPGVKLDVTGTSSGATLELFRLSNAGTGANTKARLNFYTTSTNYGSIAGGYGASAPEMVFDLPSATAGNYIWQITSAEKMRLDTSGNLGIGTTSPTSKLDVVGKITASSAISGDVIANLVNTDAGGYGLRTVGGASGGGYALSVNNYASGELMRVDGNGNVGIGTSSPTNKLDVVNNATGVTTIGVSNSNAATNDGAKLATYFGSTEIASLGHYWTGSAFISQIKGYGDLLLLTSGSERMRITSAGRVGIGTTTPTYDLDVSRTGVVAVSAATSNTQSVLRAEITSNVALDLNAVAGYGELRTANNYPLLISTNGLERMRFDTSGNVGIGTSSPVTKLDVIGGVLRTSTRVATNQKYPVGRYSPGECVFELDPTWSEAELQAFFNSSNVTWEAVADAPGGYCVYINGAVNVGGVYSSGYPYIPVDTSDVYYMECWIQNVGSNQGHYMGSIDYNQTFTSLGGNPGSFGYWVMSNTDPGNTWTKVSGYIQGFGTSVGQFVAGTKYWTPQALFNYTAGTGTRACRISGWKVIRTYQMGNRYFSGNVGIGTSSPTYILQTTGQAYFGTTGGTIQLRLGNSGAANYWGIGRDNVTTGDLVFQGQTTEYMRLTASGNLGIGTTSPSQKLTVSGNSGNVIALLEQLDNTGATTARFYATHGSGTSAKFEVGNGYSSFGTISSSPLVIGTADTERMRITSTGNVGIGTSSPAYKVDVSVSTNGVNGYNAYGDNGGTAEQIGYRALNPNLTGLFAGVNGFNYSGTVGNANNGVLYTIGNVSMVFGINSTERMRIDTSGNLGLGVTPSAWSGVGPGILELAGNAYISSTSQVLSLVTNAFYNGTNWIYKSSSYANRYDTIFGEHRWFNAPSGTAGNTISFTQAMTLDASGNLVVGASSANARIDAVGGIGVRVNEDAAGTKVVFLRSDFAGLGPSIQVSTNHPLLLLTNNTERLRITSAGNVHTPAGSTTMTDGFIYIPAAAGAPTGAATAITGTVPLYYNSSSNTLYAYNSSWQTITGGLSLVSTNANGIVYLNSGSQATTASTFVYNSSGNMGVGTNLPSNKLHVANSDCIVMSEGTAGYGSFYAKSSGTNASYMFFGDVTRERARIQSANTGDFIIYNYDGSSLPERLRITPSGVLALNNPATVLGIGVHVANNTGGAYYVASGAASGTNVAFLAYNSSNTAGAYAQLALWNNNGLSASSAAINFYSSTSGNELRILNGANAPLTFYTNNTERARITSGGAFCIGGTATVDAAPLYIKSTGTTNATKSIYAINSASTELFTLLDNGVFTTGVAASSPYNNTTASAANVFVTAFGVLQRSTSSLRYKTNVQDATHGLAELLTLRPVTFQSKNGGDTVYGGLIAEEVDAAGLTEFVEYNPAGQPDAIHYSNMVSLCVKAIQDQQAIINQLTARIAALENNQP